jgi:hypothetical protein
MPLPGRVGQLGHRLAVAAHHLDDDLQRRARAVTQVVGQVGADAEGQLAAARKRWYSSMVRGMVRRR